MNLKKILSVLLAGVMSAALLAGCGGDKAATGTTEAGRVGNRPYAKGRAYKDEHYKD